MKNNAIIETDLRRNSEYEGLLKTRNFFVCYRIYAKTLFAVPINVSTGVIIKKNNN